MFENTTTFLLWLFATWIIARFVVAIIDGYQAIDSEVRQNLRKHLNDIIHRVKIEKDQDTYYWFDLDNDKFLAQGASDEEIIGHLKSRFPTHLFFLPTNHLICAKTGWQPKPVEVKK